MLKSRSDERDAIRIHTNLESTTLNLPQLSGLVGKRVEIIVIEDQEPKARLARTRELFGGENSLDLDALDTALSEMKADRDVSIDGVIREISQE